MLHSEKLHAIAWPRATRTVVVILSCLANLHTLQAGYILKVELNHYHSNTHTKAGGTCCLPVDSSPPCTVECSNKFLFCLQPSNQSTLDSSCSLGNYSTGSISRDNATFTVGEYLDDGVPNPMVFSAPRWPGALKLYVRVDNADSSHLMSSSSEEDNSSLVAEFDVFINLSLSENRTAMVDRTRYYNRHNNGTSLFLLITLSCEKNYYGAGCNKFCRPRNDESGHYVCDNRGNMICLDGFKDEASNCTKECLLSEPGCYLDSCLHLEPCLNGATCMNTNTSGYECFCQEGFEGRNCSQESDECQPSPCKNGGICEDAHLDFVCKCPSGFTGKHCETDVDECLSSPCLNGGSCQDGRGDYQCVCVGGFKGKNCKDDPKATAFAAIVGGGAAGYFLLILIAVLLIVVIIWIARQLKHEKLIASAGDLRGKEETGGRSMVSADNPTFHELEASEAETLRDVNLIYEDIYRQSYSEENGPDPRVTIDRRYSKLDHFPGNGLKPHPISQPADFPHYSSLNLNTSDASREEQITSSSKNIKGHQYEDIDLKQDGEGEKTINCEDRPSLESRTLRNCYESVSVDAISQRSLNNNDTRHDNELGRDHETDNRLREHNTNTEKNSKPQVYDHLVKTSS